MSSSHSRHRPIVLVGALIATVIVVALGSISAFRKIESFQPLGFRAERAGGAWTVTAVEAPETHLQAGDRILLVAGEVPATTGVLVDRLRTADTTTIAVLRSEELLNLDYRRPPLEIDWTYLVLAASGLVYLFLGIYVLAQGPRRPGGLFFLWCVASAVVYLFTYLPGATSEDALARILFSTEELARVLLPALTLHLFLVFPRPLLREGAQKLIALVYVPSTFLAALHFDLIGNQGRLFFGGLDAGSIRALDRLELASLVTFSLLAVGVLVYQLLRNPEWQARRQLQWIAGGMVAGYLPFLALYFVPWAFSLSWPPWTTLAGVIPLSLVPLAFAWAIFRYRLWDVEVILRQAASYAVTLVLGVLTFSLVHLGLSRGMADEHLLTRNLLTFVAGLLIAGVLVPTERGVRRSLERLQSGAAFRRRRALAGLGRELLIERDLTVLAQTLIDQLKDGLELERVELLLDHEGALTPTDGRADLGPISLDALDAELWKRRWHLLTNPALPSAAGTAGERLHRSGYRYLFPLTLQGRPVGVLVTGLKLDGRPLNSEETALVRSLLDQTALAIENAHLMEALRQQLDEVQLLKQHSDQILDSSPAGIVVLGPNQMVDNANDAFCRLVDLPRDQLLGRPLGESFPAPCLPRPGQTLQQVSIVDGEGRERFFQASSAPYDERGELEVLVVVETTEKVEMERALREKERLASLGMLAAGVAHEVNTPITGISSYAQMLLADTPEGDPRRELLEKVERQTFRASRIVNNLLEFSRNRKQEQRVLRLDRVVDEAIEILDDKLDRSDVILRKVYPEQPVTVLGGEGELQQVVTNLISNALDAIGKNDGRVVITVDDDRTGERARILVEDDGPGIAPEELEKIFQPFYSTKLATGGTGLGLSISYQIVKRHGGQLTAESETGQGTRFTVDLPLYVDAAGAQR